MNIQSIRNGGGEPCDSLRGITSREVAVLSVAHCVRSSFTVQYKNEQ